MLTPEQQEIIMNSLWVVNTALKKQNQSANDDLRQSAILYLCKCIERYDEKLDVKWTTFAYKNVYLYIKRTLKKEQTKQAPLLSEDLYDIPMALDKSTEEELNTQIKLREVLEVCLPSEREILLLKLKGLTYRKIAEKLGLKTIVIKQMFATIKKKCRGM